MSPHEQNRIWQKIEDTCVEENVWHVDQDDSTLWNVGNNLDFKEKILSILEQEIGKARLEERERIVIELREKAEITSSIGMAVSTVHIDQIARKEQ